MKTITQEAVAWLSGRIESLESEAVVLRSEIRQGKIDKAAGKYIYYDLYSGRTQKDLDALEQKVANAGALLEELMKRAIS